MQIFASWSGERSKTAAMGLKSLLEDVFPEAIRVFISDQINPGELWAHRLGAELEQSDFGVLCLTVENFQAPWLLFEAGAVSKKVGSSRVVPYLIDELPLASNVSPLAQFQAVRADREGTYRLVGSINALRETPKPIDKLGRTFERWWPDLEQTLASLRVADQAHQVVRSERDLLENILQRVEALWLEHGNSQSVAIHLPKAELVHLLNLRYQPTIGYTRRYPLQKELRHLRDLGLIKNTQPIATLPETFQLNQQFELTDAGKNYLNEYKTVL